MDSPKALHPGLESRVRKRVVGRRLPQGTITNYVGPGVTIGPARGRPRRLFGGSESAPQVARSADTSRGSTLAAVMRRAIRRSRPGGSPVSTGDAATTFDPLGPAECPDGAPLRGSADRIYRSWTDPEELARWFPERVRARWRRAPAASSSSRPARVWDVTVLESDRRFDSAGPGCRAEWETPSPSSCSPPATGPTSP